MREDLSQLSNKSDEKDEKIASLEGDVTALKGRVAKMEEWIDAADAYEKRDTLLFSRDSVPAVKGS